MRSPIGRKPCYHNRFQPNQCLALVRDLRSARGQAVQALNQAAAVAAGTENRPDRPYGAMAASTRASLRRIEAELADLAARWERAAR